MTVTGDGDGAVDHGADERPQETRHLLGVVGEDLETEGQTVDVGAVVPDDAEGEDDQTELAESTQWGNEDLMQEPTDGVGFVSGRKCRVVDGRGGDGQTEGLGEHQGEDEADEDVEKDSGPRSRDWLVAWRRKRRKGG